MTDVMLEAALEYHRLGFPVLPVMRDKRPYVKWEEYQQRWLREGQTVGDVESMFGGYRRYGLGLLTHPYSDLLVIDLDGPDSVDLWKATGIELPLTTVHITPSKFFHYLFKGPPDCPTKISRAVRLLKEERPCGWKGPNKGCGVDLLVNGYVIVPPTPCYYEKPNCPIEHRAVLPGEVLRLLRPPHAARDGPAGDDADWLEAALCGPIFEGERNTVGTRIVGHYASLGMSAGEIGRIIRLWGANACKPPLNAHELRKLEDAALRFTAEQTKRTTAAEHFTQLWSAEQLVKHHGENIRYVPAFDRWYMWNGQRWARDDLLEIQAKVKETIGAILQEAAGETDPKRQRALAEHAVRLQSRGQIAAMTDLSRDRVAVTPNEFDRDPWLFNCSNGTLDLKSGTLRPHYRGDLITKLSPVPYDPEATCPCFHAFLHRVFGADQAVICYLQRVLGYALTGDVREDAFFIFYGSGANGKSTLVRLLLHVFGDYGTVGAPDLFLAKKQEGHSTDYADISGRRFVAVMETAEGQRLNTAKIKTHTGRDRVKARFLYHDNFTFDPTYKVAFCTNHRPVVKETGTAMWRRIVLVPFTVEIPKAEQDREMGEKLKAEGPGLLRWLVEGCLDWQRQGLEPPKAVVEATAEYRCEQDVVQRFLEERCVLSAYASVKKASLYASFVKWCEEESETVLPKRMFGDRLREKQFATKEIRGYEAWEGIALRSEGDA